MCDEANNKVSGAFIEERRKRLNQENLERLWRLEALDCLFAEAEHDIEIFHRLWMQPLVGSGSTFESALDLVIEGRFLPN